jgi:hypothetical protein
MVYSPYGLKLISRVKLKCYSEKISTEVLSKVNKVIKNLQSSKTEIQQEKPQEDPESKPRFYDKLLGRGKGVSGEGAGKTLESNLKKKYELEMEKEMESVRALKTYLDEQAVLMKKTLLSTENSTKRNLNENKKLLNENEELKIQLGEMKENIRQLNAKYKE